MFVDLAHKLRYVIPLAIEACVVEKANVAESLLALNDLPAESVSVVLAFQ